MIKDDGTELYETTDGMLHRANGPAFITHRYQEWFFNDKTHRYYGPALDNRIWYMHGKKLKDAEYVYANGRKINR